MLTRTRDQWTQDVWDRYQPAAQRHVSKTGSQAEREKRRAQMPRLIHDHTGNNREFLKACLEIHVSDSNRKHRFPDVFGIWSSGPE